MQLQGLREATESPDQRSRSELSALYLRVADTLERSAGLAEQHAHRHSRNGRQLSAAIEVQRAQRAREAAKRGRALASRLQR